MVGPQSQEQELWLEDRSQSCDTTIENQQSLILLNRTTEKSVKHKAKISKMFPATIQSCSMMRQSQATIAEIFHNKQPNTTFSILCNSIQVSGDNQDSITKCYDMIRTELLEKLHYIKFNYSNSRDVFMYRESPHRKAILESNQSRLLELNGQLYLHSFCKTQKDLEVVKEKISIEDTYSIAWRNTKHVNYVYEYVAQYLHKCLQRNAQFFQNKKVEVEMNLNNSHFYIRGGVGQDRREVRDKLVNIINSIIVSEIRTNSNLGTFKSMSSYLSKVTDHPILFTKVEEGVYILVTKDHIFKQLLQKEKFVNFLNVNQNNKIGLHILEFQRHGDKYESLKAFIAKYQYHMEEKGSFEYFVEFMKQANSELNPQVYLDFIRKVVKHLVQTKVKPTPFVKRQQQGQEKLKALPSGVFLSLGEPVPYKDISQIVQQFGCDITMTRIYLNQKHVKEYQLFDGEQAVKQLFTRVDWCKPGETRIISICRHKMGQPSYFYGKVKSNNQVSKFLPEFVIDVI